MTNELTLTTSSPVLTHIARGNVPYARMGLGVSWCLVILIMRLRSGVFIWIIQPKRQIKYGISFIFVRFKNCPLSFFTLGVVIALVIAACIMWRFAGKLRICLFVLNRGLAAVAGSVRSFCWTSYVRRIVVPLMSCWLISRMLVDHTHSTGIWILS